MRRGGSHRRRSRVGLAARLVIAVCVAWIGYDAVTQSLASSLESRQIERALALAPTDGRIMAAFSRQLISQGRDAASVKRAENIARLALQKDPTAVAAADTLGLAADLRGNAAEARRIFAYSYRLSRRDLPAQLWGIEDAVARNNIPDALMHYDIALRTSKSAPNILFPILAYAVNDANVRASLVRTLARRPAWGSAFTDYLANNDPDPGATSSLFRGLIRLGVPVSEGARATLIAALIGSGSFEDAWNFYKAIRPGANRNVSRDPRFVSQLVSPSAFDWVLVSDASIYTSIQREGARGMFDFHAPASVGGALLSQLQLLPPGDYVLEGHSVSLDQPDSSRPYWLLSCRDGRELGRMDMPNSEQANGRFSGRFRVPYDCPVQSLTLVARASDQVSGVGGQIDFVRLHRAQ